MWTFRLIPFLLLLTVLLWTLECMYPFELEFSSDTCPEMGLLDHMVTVFSFLRNLHTVLRFRKVLFSPHPLQCLLFVDFFFFLPFYFFNWRIITLQNFVVFCHTSTKISHRYTHVPSLLNLPSISPLSRPSRLSQSPCLSSLSHTANSHWLSILHMVL